MKTGRMFEYFIELFGSLVDANDVRIRWIIFKSLDINSFRFKPTDRLSWRSPQLCLV